MRCFLVVSFSFDTAWCLFQLVELLADEIQCQTHGGLLDSDRVHLFVDFVRKIAYRRVC